MQILHPQMKMTSNFLIGGCFVAELIFSSSVTMFKAQTWSKLKHEFWEFYLKPEDYNITCLSHLLDLRNVDPTPSQQTDFQKSVIWVEFVPPRTKYFEHLVHCESYHETKTTQRNHSKCYLCLHRFLDSSVDQVSCLIYVMVNGL